jgi:aspartyl-tRNA(Asn)/glutamyl-tRNA(Gln) amidotransferase subunit A
MTDLHQLGIHALSGLIAARKISVLEVTDALIARCNAMRDQTHAFVTPTFDLARDIARSRDAELAKGISRGQLHGIPIGLKDAIDAADIQTTLCGSYTPRRSAAVWQSLDAAGAVLMGKLHCAGYCLGTPGMNDAVPFARHPFDASRTPGASSSGSAVALANGLVPAALGTDTGGSIRIPASFCGIVGLKPTNGLLSRDGVFPLAPSLDQVGPMARDSRDCAILLDAMAPGSGSYAGGLTQRLDGLRVGHVAHFSVEAGVTSEYEIAVQTTLASLAALGATIEEVTLPPLQAFTDCFLPLMLSEAYGLHAKAIQHDQAMPDSTRARLQIGAMIDPADVTRAKAQRARLTQAVDAIWTRVDVLVFPIVPADPPRIDCIEPLAYMRAPMLAVPANLVGVPAVSIPCGFSEAGLPIGLQILAPRFCDGNVLRVAHAYETETGLTGPRPRQRPKPYSLL